MKNTFIQYQIQNIIIVGYIINGKIVKLTDLENYFLFKIDTNYSFTNLFIIFTILKQIILKYNLTLLLLVKNKDYINSINNLLSILSIKNVIFIDDYNINPEILNLIYLNDEILFNKNKILYFDINTITTKSTDFDLFLLFTNIINNSHSNIISFNLDINNIIAKLKQKLPNLNQAMFYNLNDDNYFDIFKLTKLLNKYKSDFNIVLTKHKDIYENIFPQNTTFITLNEFTSDKYIQELIKLLLFTYTKSTVFNTDYILSFLSLYLKHSLNFDSSYKLIYNNYTNNKILNYAKQVNYITEYSSEDNCINKKLNLGIITRVTRPNNLLLIYNSIKTICTKYNSDYTWFLIIPYDKSNDIIIPNEIKSDLSVKIIDNFMSFNDNDIYDSTLLNLVLKHKNINYCQFVYILDDDNLLHPNIINILYKHIDKYLIINRLELTDAQKIQSKLANIECPLELTTYTAIGGVDFSNIIFNVNALHFVNGFNLEQGSLYCDGATVKRFLEYGIEPTYSNELGGYYNKLTN